MVDLLWGFDGLFGFNQRNKMGRFNEFNDFHADVAAKKSIGSSNNQYYKRINWGYAVLGTFPGD
jgi:hypothetical protein